MLFHRTHCSMTLKKSSLTWERECTGVPFPLQNAVICNICSFNSLMYVFTHGDKMCEVNSVEAYDSYSTAHKSSANKLSQLYFRSSCLGNSSATFSVARIATLMSLLKS